MEAPKLPSFIRQNQHKRFEFTPRYYDERKERLEEMRKKYRDGSAEEKHSATDMRLRMSTEWAINRAKRPRL
ncbi:MAG: hypothetical protein U5L96_11130 [Owenweeksia sp.]|nr:hypothetical protein [Owenweeksia sp.]